MRRLALLFVPFLAAFPPPTAGDGSDWKLFRGLHAGGRLELQVEDPALAEALARRLGPWSGVLPLETVVVEPGRSDGRSPRVVVARVGGAGAERAARLCSGSAVELAGEGLRVLGEALDGPRDAVLLCREDPERAGRPLSILVGGAEAPLAALVALHEPRWRPGVSVWRDGRPAGRAEGARPSALERPEPTAQRAVGPRLEVRATAAVEPALVAPLARRAELVAARVEGWLGGEAPARPHPLLLVADPRDPRLDGALARPLDGDQGVVALALSGVRDDGGAAVALVRALSLAGEPAAPWLRDAIGPAVARAWWGHGLEQWVAQLAAAGLALEPDELVDPTAPARHSPHRLVPLRAWLLVALLAEGADPGELWRAGPDPALLPRAEARLRRSLEELARSWRAEHGQEPLPRPAPEPPPRGFATGRPAGLARESLAWARERGARAIAAEVLASFEALPSSLSAPPPVEPSIPDGVLAAGFDGARALGLSTALFLRPLAAPTAVEGDQAARARAADWARFFDRWEALALHYALLAELQGCDLYAFGEELTNATDVVSLAGDPRKRELKRARLEELVERLRAAFRGRLAYSSPHLEAIERLSFVEGLDVLGIVFLPALRADLEPEARALRGLLRHQLGRLAQAAQEHGRPIALLPVGLPSCEGAAHAPAAPVPRPDLALQARWYEALAEALAEAPEAAGWLGGLFLWELTGEERARGDWGYDPRGKPAEAALPRLFGG